MEDSFLYIERYIHFIERTMGCQIVIKDFCGFTPKNPEVATQIYPSSIHQSPFCMYMKFMKWGHCLRATSMLYQRCGSSACFTGMCYCGFSELILPVRYENKTIAAICVGGFDLDGILSRKRLERACKMLNIDYQNALDVYNKSISPILPDLDQLTDACGILVDFCQMYYTSLAKSRFIDPHREQLSDAMRLTMLTNIIEYVHMHYRQDIRLSAIAVFCHCSESYISHLFKKNMNINIFINRVRINHAQTMLLTEKMSVQQVASACGYADSNYFAKVFKKETGMTPTQYRANYAAEEIRFRYQ